MIRRLRTLSLLLVFLVAFQSGAQAALLPWIVGGLASYGIFSAGRKSSKPVQVMEPQGSISVAIVDKEGRVKNYDLPPGAELPALEVERGDFLRVNLLIALGNRPGAVGVLRIDGEDRFRKEEPPYFFDMIPTYDLASGVDHLIEGFVIQQGKHALAAAPAIKFRVVEPGENKLPYRWITPKDVQADAAPVKEAEKPEVQPVSTPEVLQSAITGFSPEQLQDLGVEEEPEESIEAVEVVEELTLVDPNGPFEAIIELKVQDRNSGQPLDVYFKLIVSDIEGIRQAEVLVNEWGQPLQTKNGQLHLTSNASGPRKITFFLRLPDRTEWHRVTEAVLDAANPTYQETFQLY